MLTYVQLVLLGIIFGGILALCVVGFNLMFGVMKLLNLAYGSLVMISAYITYWLYTLWGIEPYFAPFIVSPILFLLGLIIQKLLFNPLLKKENFTILTLLVTYGLFFVLDNIALIMWGGEWRMMLHPIFSSAVVIYDIRLPNSYIFATIIAFPVLILMYWFLKKTFIGKAIRATAEDPRMTELLGIKISNIGYLTSGISSILAGLAGVTVSTAFVLTPYIGFNYLLLAFIVLVLGGPGNFIGSLLGSVLIGVVFSLATYLLGPEWHYFVGLIVLISIIMIRVRYGVGIH